MSRFNPDHNVAPVLDAAAQWIQRCLIDERSLFTDQPLWTATLVEEVRAAFVDHPDESDAKFFDKLEGQMRPASANAKRLMAEMLWALMLFQSNIGAAKKRESIALVWGWSGTALDMTHPLLSDAALEGVGNPGTAYNTGRWREIGYLIGLSLDLAQRSRDERSTLFVDRDRFEQWLKDAPQEGYRQYRHVLRYLAFPDLNERITQNRDRRLILEAYTDAAPKVIHAMSDAEQDDALRELRGQLQAEHGSGDLDFYMSPLVERWRKPKESSKAVIRADSPFDLGYAALREQFLAQFPDFTTFDSYPAYVKEEREYKDELVGLFAQTVSPEIAAGNWAAAGVAAVALLTHPLKKAANKPQNIVGWRYVDFIRQLSTDQHAALGRGLAELFDETRSIAPRVDEFVEQLQAVIGIDRNVPAAAQRSITSFYLTLWDPQHHLFLKTREMQRAFRQVDPGFQWSSARLTGADVERTDAIAAELYLRLDLEDWEPQDFLDVQGFLWVATAYDSPGVEEDNEDSETMDTHSTPATNQPKPPQNQILFGPPGTGKTFATIDKALAILDPDLVAKCDPVRDRSRMKTRFDELIAAKRIRFVTFHQSFSYEDFVEGLRADNGEGGQLQYRVEAGVFKSLCDDARGAAQVAEAVGIRDGARIWKVSIDGTGPSATRDYCFKHQQARIGWGEVGDLRDADLPDRPAYQQLGSNDRNTLQAFCSDMQPGDIVLCIGSATTVQAIGVVQDEYMFESATPPDVRKDYGNVLPVRWLATGLSLNLQSLNGGVRFTLKTVYEIARFSWQELANVVEAAGIRLKGTVPAPQRQALDHVLIIDEINRGNVSRIFGELITLIEPSKRAGAAEHLQVTLPYSKKLFDVPKNVYLIGTMNTADRSLAGMDIALRRRFKFVEMPPRPELLQDVVIQGIKVADLLTEMNRRIEVLLDRDHQLGHAWFMGLSSGTDIDPLANVFRYEILPLLQEYFFEDWERIAQVLNDESKAAEFQFVSSVTCRGDELWEGSSDTSMERKLWRVNDKAFTKADSYLQIVSKAKA